MRGSVARIHTKTVASTIVFRISCMSYIIGTHPVYNLTVNKLINKMFIYSAIKISANIPALYSTLNPDTNSDSPSAKSNGVRFVSARFVINHITNSGIIIKSIHEYDFIILSSMVLCSIRTESKIRAIDTS